MVLAKATVRASLFLGMNEAIPARTLGLSEPAVALILNSEKPINPESKARRSVCSIFKPRALLFL